MLPAVGWKPNINWQLFQNPTKTETSQSLPRYLFQPFLFEGRLLKIDI